MRALILSVLILSSSPAFAGDIGSSSAKLNWYPARSSGGTSATVNLASNLNDAIEYSSFINYGFRARSPQTNQNYLTEQNVRWRPVAGEPRGWSAQAVVSSTSKEILRLGAIGYISELFGKWLHNRGFDLIANWHVLQLDDNPDSYGQFELIYGWSLIPGRLKLNGFFDINYGRLSYWLSEHQLELNLNEHFLIVAEARFNEMAAPRWQWASGFAVCGTF